MLLGSRMERNGVCLDESPVSLASNGSPGKWPEKCALQGRCGMKHEATGCSSQSSYLATLRIWFPISGPFSGQDKHICSTSGFSFEHFKVWFFWFQVTEVASLGLRIGCEDACQARWAVAAHFLRSGGLDIGYSISWTRSSYECRKKHKCRPFQSVGRTPV